MNIKKFPVQGCASLLIISADYRVRVGVFSQRLAFCSVGLDEGRQTTWGAATPGGHRWAADTVAGSFQTRQLVRKEKSIGSHEEVV